MKYHRLSFATVKKWSVLAVLFVLTACYSPTTSGPDEMYLEGLLGNLAEGRGCSFLDYLIGSPNVMCEEIPNRDLPASGIFIDKITGCRVTGSDVPHWAFGYDFRFERLGQTALGTWIYEGYGDFTYIVKDRNLVDFCKGRIQPTDSFPPCSCADVDLAFATTNNPVDSEGDTERWVSRTVGVPPRGDAAVLTKPTAKPR